MSNVFFLCFSFVLGLSMVGCRDRKDDSEPSNTPQVSLAIKERPSREEMDVNIIQTNTKIVSQSKERFGSLFVSTAHQLTGKDIADGITTWDDSNNPSETQFPDGSKILYASGRLHQYVDANNKVTSYNNNEKNLPISSVDSAGFIEQFIYDPDGNLISKRDKYGKIVPIGKIGIEK